MKISVLTPSYNTGKYLERAIQSVLAQHYHNVEHIVIDGGSTDDTLSILKKYDHLKWVSEPDKGQSDAMNKAFEASSGSIVVYLNADDEFEPGAFAEVAKAFKHSPKADMVVGKIKVSDISGERVRNPSVKYTDLVHYWRDKFPNNPVGYFYKRKVQAEIGVFPLEDHYSMDIWFLLKAYQKFVVLKTDAVLGTFYSDGTNKTAVSDVGQNLHNVVKNHLKKNDPLKLPYFYLMLAKKKLQHKYKI